MVVFEDAGRPARCVEAVGGDVVLRGIQWPGAEPTIVLVHGLAGHAGEWVPVVVRLDERLGVVAFDQRGHGRSTRTPHGMTRSAHADDVAAVVRSVAAAPVTLVGHSLGGHTAMLTAVRHPDLVGRLVMIEASPGGPNPTAVDNAARWLASWPVPFPTRNAAVEFFGGGTAGRAWTDGLTVTTDGVRPRFETATILRALEEIAGRSWWDEWEAVLCPTVVMRGASGWLSDDDVDRMARAGSSTRVVVVADAGHDVHLDQPARVSEHIVDCAPGRS